MDRNECSVDNLNICGNFISANNGLKLGSSGNRKKNQVKIELERQQLGNQYRVDKTRLIN